LENCTFFGREVLSLEVGSDDATQIECVRNTFVGVQAFSATGSGQVTVDARQNVFDVNLVAQRRNGDSNFPPDRTWHGVSNLYSLVHPARSPGLRNHSPAPDLARLIATVDTNSAMGDARIRSRLMERNRLPGRISALEFCPAPAVTNTTPKLAPETLWRVGADVALVGPGPAYRKWRAGPSHEGLLVPARLSTH